MSQLNVVAIFSIKPEFQAEFQPEFKKLTEVSRQEKGCIRYDISQDIKDSNIYVFTETWASQQAIDIHTDTDHFKHFISFINGKVNDVVIRVMKQVI